MSTTAALERNPQRAERLPARTARATLASLSLPMLLASLGTSIANVALPTMASELHASFTSVRWVIAVYLLAVTAFTLVAGRLGDLTNPRRLLLTGIALFTAASIACAASPSPSALIAARTVQGVGAAIMMALAMALVSGAFPRSVMGRAMGSIGAMSAIGTAIGPSLGGTLIASFGWRAIFFATAVLGVTTLLVAARYLPRELHGSHEARANAATLETLSVTGAGLAMSVLVSTVMMSTLIVGPFYLSRGFALDAAQVGFVMSAGPIAAALASIPAGRLADSIGAPRTTFLGLTGMATGLLMLGLIPAAGVAAYVVSIVTVTIGYALFQTANNTAVMQQAGSRRRGLASGMLNLSRNIGLIAGASFMGSVFARASGSDAAVATSDAAGRGIRVTYALATGLVLVAMGVALSATRRPMSPRETVSRPYMHGDST